MAPPLPEVTRERALIPNDWPVVALAIATAAPIWTEDADFLGSGVATWTTRTVEIYLAGSPVQTQS
jgi:predicted nucleic acid-binding protein